jgi:hypothetical protein
VTKEKRGPRGGESTVFESGLLRKTAYFNEDEWEAIRKRAFDEQVSFAQVIRDAVRSYFDMDE